MNSRSVRPMKGRTALASRCLRSPPFDEPTRVRRSRKLCGGGRDRGREEEEGGGGVEVGAGEEGGEEEEEVFAPMQSSPVQSEIFKGETRDQLVFIGSSHLVKMFGRKRLLTVTFH